MQAGDLLLGHLHLLECGGDLLEGEIARARGRARPAPGAPAAPPAARSNPDSAPAGPSPTARYHCLHCNPVPLPGAGPIAPTWRSIGSQIAYASCRWQPVPPPLSPPTTPDVQSGTPATQVSLSRVGVTGVEKVIRVKADGAENLYHAGFRVLRRPQSTPGGRPHVALRGSRRRGDRRGRARRGLPRRGARRPHRPAGARAPGRAAGRGLGHGALPGDGHDPGQRHQHAGDLRPASAPRSTRCAARGR